MSETDKPKSSVGSHQISEALPEDDSLQLPLHQPEPHPAQSNSQTSPPQFSSSSTNQHQQTNPVENDNRFPGVGRTTQIHPEAQMGR